MQQLRRLKTKIGKQLLAWLLTINSLNQSDTKAKKQAVFISPTLAIALSRKSSNLNHAPLKQSKLDLANEIYTALEQAADWSKPKAKFSSASS